MNSLSLRVALLACLGWFLAMPIQSQNIRTIGPGSDYLTLKDAFDAVNNGLITGEIVFQVEGSTQEVAGAILNPSGTGSSSFSSITIYPAVPGVRIAGNLSGPLIDFAGVSNVFIDGRLNMTGSTRDLIIENTEYLNSNARTIRFINSASNISVKYCEIRGGTPSSSAGMIFFSTAGSGLGNHQITIADCLISNTAGNRPTNSIYSNGSTTGLNHNIHITNNHFKDFFREHSFSYGINLVANTDNWFIEGNHFYETTIFSPAGPYGYMPVRVFVVDANRFIISNNFIGGSAPGCTGAPWMMHAGVRHHFRGIYIRNANHDLTLVADNRISNFDCSTTDANPWQGIVVFSGKTEISGNVIGSASGNGNVTIRLTTGYLVATTSGTAVDEVMIVGGGKYDAPPQITFHGTGSGAAAFATLAPNGVINSVTVTNGGTGYTSPPTIRLETQSTNHSTVHPIWINSQGDVLISNNTIGSFSLYGSAYYACGFEGIQCTQSQTGNLIIENNTIGNISDSLNICCEAEAPLAATGQRMYGIYTQAGGSTLIIGNTISGLTNRYNGNNAASVTIGILANRGSNTIEKNKVSHLRTYSGNPNGYSNASIIGIGTPTSAQSGLVQKISDNEVSHLVNLHPNARVDLYGIYMNGAANTWHQVSGNHLHHFSLNTTDNGSFIDAMVLYTGKTNCFNNIINLSNDYWGYGNNGTYHQIGIWHHATSNSDVNVHHNTVILDGAIDPTSTTSSSYAFWNNGNLTIKNITNNVFVNTRLGGQGGAHYAIRMAGNNNVNINFNNYFTHLGSPLGRYGTTDRITLNDWMLSTGQDGFSTALDPSFIQQGPAVWQRFAPSAALPGQFLADYPFDFDGTPRTSIPTMGALEQMFVWSGQLSTQWGIPDNWAGNTLPVAGKGVWIPAMTIYKPHLDQERSVGTLAIEAGASLTIPPNTFLTVNGELRNGQGIDGLFIFEDSHGSGSLIHQTTGVQATIQSYLPGAAGSWHMISAPVADMEISGSDFEPTSSDDFYLWHEPAPGTWVNFKNQDGSGGNPTFPEANQNGNRFVPGSGYLVAYQQINPSKAFSGVLNAGQVTIPLQHSGSKGWTWEAGWNLIGNPYASSIDWNLVDKTSLAEIHAQVYDPAFGAGGGYRIVNQIAPHQGFFVKASSPGGSVVLKTGLQTHGAAFFKTHHQLFVNNLTLSIKQQAFYDETHLIVAPGTSMGYDFYDATKLFSYNPQAPQIFSRSSDDRWLNVNAIPEVPLLTGIPLSFSTAAAGSTEIALSDLTGQMAKVQVYLYDLLMDSVVNLTTKLRYLFESTPGEHPDRFLLRFVMPDTLAVNGLNAYAFDNTLVVHSLFPSTQLSVFTLHGQQVLQMTMEPGTHHLPTGLSKGVYLVKLHSSEATFNRKLFLRGQ